MLKGTSSSSPMGSDHEDEGDHFHGEVLMAMSGMFSLLLQVDIFLNIFSRLPLKSLSQCRWVCKSWYNLIKHPSFAKFPYEWAIQNFSPFVILHGRNKDFYLVDHQVFDNFEISAPIHNLKFNKFEPTREEREVKKLYGIVGSVNGLICFSPDPDRRYHPSPYYICNPITGEHITLPKSPKQDQVPLISAFGYDPTSDEYKVIRFVQNVDMLDEKLYLKWEGEVYTLGSSKWRRIEDNVPYIYNTIPYSPLVNGHLHWISYKNVNRIRSRIVVAFNVGKEKFHLFQTPPCIFPDKEVVPIRLGVVEERLCFVHEGTSMHCYEIWVMNDYGVESSWVKEYVLSERVMSWFHHGSCELIKLRNGEFLLQYEYENEILVYYNPKDQTCRPIMVYNQKDHYQRSIMQAGSLFSPKIVGRSKSSH